MQNILTKIGGIIVIAALITQIFLGCSAAFSQTPDKVLKDTTINKVTVKLYKGARGGKYILVTSKNGSTYKRYFR